jgi:hypothetical protein
VSLAISQIGDRDVRIYRIVHGGPQTYDGADMNRLQMIVAVGLFLIVALFGWQTYLQKSSHKNRSDTRGLPTKFIKEVEVFETSSKAAERPANRQKTQPGNTDAPAQPVALPKP